MGRNNHGQFGDGTTIDSLVPKRSGTGFISIEAGGDNTVALKPDGSLWAWGQNELAGLGDGTMIESFVPVQIGTGYAVSTVTLVTEFYNTMLDNYFITANANEAAAIDNGSAGPGWRRTGNTFKSGGGTSVCRFYGSLSPGPNSHFYTADAAECASLKQIQATTPATDKRWNFESLDFQTTASANQVCPPGTAFVYRAYNNGFARGVDSNHRITSSQTAIQEVVAKGWKDEGVVMCAPI